MESSDVASPAHAKQPAADTVDGKLQLPSPSGDNEGQGVGPDVFERRGSADSGVVGEGNGDEGFVLSRSLQDPSEELPIELISLTDR